MLNKLATELREKSESLMKESNDTDLLDAAFFMEKASRSIESYEIKRRRKEYDPTNIVTIKEGGWL